jgi:PAS domain S-box-containing protein
MSEVIHVLAIGVAGGAVAVRELLGGGGEGIELVEAPAGVCAAEARLGEFDCILSGHHLPELDAREVLDSLKRAGVSAPLIVLSDHGDERLVVELMKGGVCDYLVGRQTTGEMLEHAVRAAVQKCRTRAGPEMTAQQRLVQTTRSRDEAVALLDTLVGGAPVGIAFFDPRLRYVRVNREQARINGLSVEAHLGKYLFDALPKMNPQVGEDLREVLRTGNPIVNVDVTGQTPADPGVDHDWIASYYPVRASGGELLGVGATVIDITDRKRHNRELAQAKETAEAANRSKDQFLAVLSHELRTPLTPVLMAVQSLQEGEMSQDLRGMLAMIRRNVELEARLIDDLLDLTRIAKGKLQLHLEMIDAHELVRSAVEICRGEIEAKGLSLTVELEARRHFVYADSARLQQVFWNLINNAVKFTPAGGRLAVRSCDDAGDRLVTEVCDSGIGIEAGTLSRIFGAFEQGEGTVTRRFGGLGLGLAICRALVRMHWGVITAASGGKGKGSTFTVSLGGHAQMTQVRGSRDGRVAGGGGAGASAGTAASAVEVSDSPQVKPEPSRCGERRVLMVDDHADTRAAMRRLLERCGYQVTTADSVEAALRKATDTPVDILISDIGLPDGSGLEIMRHLRDRGRDGGGGGHGPVRGIALSGFGMEEDIRKSREAGFEHHLTKPVTFDRLRSVLLQLEEPGRG